MVAAAFVIALGYGLVAPIIPQFARTFDVGFTAASAVVSIFAASRLLFATPSGALVDRIGSRKVYLSGLLSVAITTGMVAFAQAYWQILVLRALAGIGSTMFTVSAMALIIKLAPPSIRAKSSSAYGSGFLFGSILGPIIGAALSVFGMRIPFLLYAIALSCAAGIVWYKMPKNVGVVEDKATRLPALSFWEAFADHAYRASLVAVFANGWSNFGVRVAVVPLFAATAFENSAAMAGFAMTAFAAGNALALQFSGRLADSWGRKPLILLGLGINGAFTAVFGIAHAPIVFLGSSVIAGFGCGLFGPAQQAVLADIVGNSRSGGRPLAVFQMTQDFGAILGPLIVGLIADRFGFVTAFVMCGVLTCVACMQWLFGRETLLDISGNQA